MTEQERIHALLEEGKISQEEADLLLEALAEADAAEAEASTFESSAADAPGFAAAAPNPPQPERPPQAPNPQDSSAPRSERPDSLRWLTIRMLAKSVEIRSDETLSEPKVEGAQLERDGTGWRFEAQGLESLLSPGSLVVYLPPDVGVDLSTKAGNVEVRDAAFFKGRVVAGNVELTRVRGVDLELKAGNLDAELLLSEGEHRIQVAMGNADVELLRGSSVRIKGRASMGQMNIAGPAQLGGGEASLDLHVKMGNLDVKVPRE